MQLALHLVTLASPMTTNLFAEGFKRFDILVYLFIFFLFSLAQSYPSTAAGIGGHAVRTEHKLASLSNIAFFRGVNTNKPQGKQLIYP
jgi:hypothetical protein